MQPSANTHTILTWFPQYLCILSVSLILAWTSKIFTILEIIRQGKTRQSYSHKSD